MKTIDKIKLAFGISQRSLAQFLGADHSHVSRYANNTRGLSSSAQTQLTIMHTSLSNMPVAMNSEFEEGEILELLSHAAWCRSQCIPLRKQYTLMQSQFKQACLLLQFLDVLKTSSPSFSVQQQRWINEQMYQANRKKKQNSLVAQQKLLIKIELLNYEADLIGEAVKRKYLLKTNEGGDSSSSY